MEYFKTIAAYCEAINIVVPRHPHFDIRSFAENMPTVIQAMEPFRHEFYAIAIKLDGGGAAYVGAHKNFPQGSTIFFNTPFQVISWDIAPDWEGYYVMFTQEFISQAKGLADLLEDFPFLRIDRALPFTIDHNDIEFIHVLFDKIYAEYHSEHDDKFNFIEVYVLLLLNYIRRYFSEQLDSAVATSEIRKADLKLLTRFQALIEMSFNQTHHDPNANLHSVSHYAAQLGIHPNHLNAVVKEISGQTAQQIIQHHVVQLAKTYLVQTDMAISEVSDTLGFDSPNYFSRFFKKNTTFSPSAYRTQHSL